MSFKCVKVGVVQATPFLFDKSKTVERAIEWIEKAAQAKCELLLFPESFIPCYPRGLNFDSRIGRRTEKSREHWLDYWKNSIEYDSEEVLKIGEAVRKARMYVALGVTEREPVGGSLHCALF